MVCVVQCFGPNQIELSICDDRNGFFFPFSDESKSHRVVVASSRNLGGTRNYRHSRRHHYSSNIDFSPFLCFFPSVFPGFSSLDFSIRPYIIIYLTYCIIIVLITIILNRDLYCKSITFLTLFNYYYTSIATAGGLPAVNR